MKKIFVTVGFLSAAISQQAFSAGYGMAGCGLGSVIFGNQKGIVQIFAATTNGTSSNQTFGITSGTSNCTDSGGRSSSIEAEQKDFIANNLNDLRKDVAQGQGEALKAYSAVLGCSENAVDQVAGQLQRNYADVFENNDVVAVLTATKSVLGKDASLKAKCSSLI